MANSMTLPNTYQIQNKRKVPMN